MAVVAAATAAALVDILAVDTPPVTVTPAIVTADIPADIRPDIGAGYILDLMAETAAVLRGDNSLRHHERPRNSAVV
jgi:hypothetical protein